MEKLVKVAESLCGVPVEVLQEELTWLPLALLGLYGVLHLADKALRPESRPEQGRAEMLPATREVH